MKTQIPERNSVRLYRPEEVEEECNKRGSSYWSIEAKYPGYRVIVNRHKDESITITDVSGDVLFKIPQELENSLQTLAKIPYSVEGMLSWEEDDDGNESAMLRVFDVRSLGNDEYADSPWMLRKRVVSSLNYGNRVREIYSIVSRTPFKIRESAELMSKIHGSIGAIIKKSDAPLEIGTENQDWITYDTGRSFRFIIIQNRKEEGESDVGIPIDRGNNDEMNMVSASDLVTKDGFLYLKVGTIPYRQDSEEGEVYEFDGIPWRTITSTGNIIRISNLSKRDEYQGKNTIRLTDLAALADYYGTTICAGSDTPESFMNELMSIQNQDMENESWSAAYVNDLPDSAFAYVEPGAKDETGKTTPRSKRHLPYKDKNGKIDAPHVRNALARLSQTHISDSAKASAKAKLKAAAKEIGVETGD
jgi:hypothetical protein